MSFFVTNTGAHAYLSSTIKETVADIETVVKGGKTLVAESVESNHRQIEANATAIAGIVSRNLENIAALTTCRTTLTENRAAVAANTLQLAGNQEEVRDLITVSEANWVANDDNARLVAANAAGIAAREAEATRNQAAIATCDSQGRTNAETLASQQLQVSTTTSRVDEDATRLSAHSATMVVLDMSIAEAAARNEAITAALGRLEEDLHSSNTSLEDVRTQVAATGGAVATAVRAVDDGATRDAETQGFLEEGQRVLDEGTSHLATNATTLASHATAIDELRRAAESLTTTSAAVAAVAVDVGANATAIAAQEATLALHMDTLVRHDGLVGEHTRQLGDLRWAVETTEAQATTLDAHAATMAEHQERLDGLEVTMSDAVVNAERIAENTRRIEAADSANGATGVSLAACEATATAQATSLATQVATLAAQEARLAAQDTTLGRLDEEVRVLSATTGTYDTTLATQAVVTAEVRGDVGAHAADVAAQAEEVAAVRTVARANAEHLAAGDATALRQDAAVEAQEARFATEAARLDGVRDDLATAVAAQGGLAATVAAQRETIDGHASQLAAAHAIMADHAGAVAAQRDDITAQDAAIDALEARVAASEAGVDGHAAAVATTEAHVTELGRRVEDHEARLATRGTEVAAVHEAVAATEAEVGAAETSLAGTHEELAAVASQQAALAATVEDTGRLHATIAASAAENATALATLRDGAVAENDGRLRVCEDDGRLHEASLVALQASLDATSSVADANERDLERCGGDLDDLVAATAANRAALDEHAATLGTQTTAIAGCDDAIDATNAVVAWNTAQLVAHTVSVAAMEATVVATADQVALQENRLVAVSALDPLRSNVGFSVDRPLRSVVDLNELRGVGGGARVTYLYATDAHGTVLLLPHHLPMPADPRGASPFTPYAASSEVTAAAAAAAGSYWIRVANANLYRGVAAHLLPLQDMVSGRLRWVAWVNAAEAAEAEARATGQVHRHAPGLCFRSASDVYQWYRLQGIVPDASCDGVYRIDAGLATASTWEVHGIPLRGHWVAATTTATAAARDTYCVFRDGSGWELMLADVGGDSTVVAWDDPAAAVEFDATVPSLGAMTTTALFTPFATQTHVDAVLVEGADQRDWASFVFDNDPAFADDYGRDTTYRFYDTGSHALRAILVGAPEARGVVRQVDGTGAATVADAYLSTSTESRTPLDLVDWVSDAREFCEVRRRGRSGSLAGWTRFSLRHMRSAAAGPTTQSACLSFGGDDATDYYMLETVDAAGLVRRQVKQDPAATVRCYVRRRVPPQDHAPRTEDGLRWVIPYQQKAVTAHGLTFDRPLRDLVDVGLAAAASSTGDGSRMTHLWVRDADGETRAVPCRIGGGAETRHGSTPYLGLAETAVPGAVAGAQEESYWVGVDDVHRYGVPALAHLPRICVADGVTGQVRWCVWLCASQVTEARAPAATRWARPAYQPVHAFHDAAAHDVSAAVVFRSANDVYMWYVVQGHEPSAAHDGIYLLDPTMDAQQSLRLAGGTPVRGFWRHAGTSEDEDPATQTYCVFRDQSGWELAFVDAAATPLAAAGTPRGWDQPANAGEFVRRDQVCGPELLDQSRCLASLRDQTHVDAVMVEGGDASDWATFVFDNDGPEELRVSHDVAYSRWSTGDATLLGTLRAPGLMGRRYYYARTRATGPHEAVADDTSTGMLTSPDNPRRLFRRHRRSTSDAFVGWDWFATKHRRVVDASDGDPVYQYTWFSFGADAADGSVAGYAYAASVAQDTYALARGDRSDTLGTTRLATAAPTVLRVYLRRGIRTDTGEYDHVPATRPHAPHAPPPYPIRHPIRPGEDSTMPLQHLRDLAEPGTGVVPGRRSAPDDGPRYLWTRDAFGGSRAVPYDMRRPASLGATPFTPLPSLAPLAADAEAAARPAWVVVEAGDGGRYEAAGVPRIALVSAAGTASWRAWVSRDEQMVIRSLPAGPVPRERRIQATSLASTGGAARVMDVVFRSASDVCMWYRQQGIAPGAAHDGIYRLRRDMDATSVASLLPVAYRGVDGELPVSQTQTSVLRGYWAAGEEGAADGVEPEPTYCVFRDGSGWELAFVDADETGDGTGGAGSEVGGGLSYGAGSRAWAEAVNRPDYVPHVAQGGFGASGWSGHEYFHRTGVYATMGRLSAVDGVLVESSDQRSWASFVFDNDPVDEHRRHRDRTYQRYSLGDATVPGALTTTDDAVGTVHSSTGTVLGDGRAYVRLRPDAGPRATGAMDAAATAVDLCARRAGVGDDFGDWAYFSLRHRNDRGTYECFSFGSTRDASDDSLLYSLGHDSPTPTLGDAPRYKRAGVGLLRCYLRRALGPADYPALLVPPVPPVPRSLTNAAPVPGTRGSHASWPLRHAADLDVAPDMAPDPAPDVVPEDPPREPPTYLWVLDVFEVPQLLPFDLSDPLRVGAVPFHAASPGSPTTTPSRPRWTTPADVTAYADRPDVPRVLLRGSDGSPRWCVWVRPGDIGVPEVRRMPMAWHPRTRDGDVVCFRSANDVKMWHRMQGIEANSCLDGVYLLVRGGLAEPQPLVPQHRTTPVVGYWATATAAATVVATHCVFRGGSGWELMLVDTGRAAECLPYGSDVGWGWPENCGPYPVADDQRRMSRSDADAAASVAVDQVFAPLDAQTSVDAVLVEHGTSGDWASFVFDNDRSGGDAHRYSTGESSLRAVLLDPAASTDRGVVRRGDGTDAPAPTYAHAASDSVAGATASDNGAGRTFCARHRISGATFTTWSHLSLRHQPGDPGSFSWLSFGDAMSAATPTTGAAYLLATGGTTRETPGTTRWRTEPTGMLRLFLRRELRPFEYSWFVGAGGFTGVHRNPTLRAPDELRPGLLLESTGVMASDVTISHAYTYVDLTTRAKSKRVYGVVETVGVAGDMTVNSLGEGAIWVCSANGPLENGDYITSSDLPGIGMRQTSDRLMNYTVAKATVDCDFRASAAVWLDAAGHPVDGHRSLPAVNDVLSTIDPTYLPRLAQTLANRPEDHATVAAARRQGGPAAARGAYDAIAARVRHAEDQLFQDVYGRALSDADVERLARLHHMQGGAVDDRRHRLQTAAQRAPYRGQFIACTYHCG